MKTVKLLLLSTLMFVVPAVAMDFCNPSIRQAAVDLFELVEDCDRNDGEHKSRMNAFIESSHNLSAIECKRILESRVDSAKRKSQRSQCDNCRDIDLLIRAGIDTCSKEIEAGRGDMSVMDLRKEYFQRAENK